jgi:AraC-like DNA-binding protein
MGTTSTTKHPLEVLIELTSHGEDLSCLDAPKQRDPYGVTLLKVSQFIPREPVLYEPCAVFVLQGSKHGYVGDKSVIYDPKHFLVLSVPLPFECETTASPAKPMLAVYVRLRREVVTELLSTMRWSERDGGQRPKTIEATPLTPDIEDNLRRLLETKRSTIAWTVLGEQIVRELTYRVLIGPHGFGLRAIVDSSGHFAQISRVLQDIQTNYAEDLSVEKLANSIGMSQSVFHHHFREVTATSPLQYIKAIRLHRARSLMRHEGLGTSTAAMRVGYESRSQFAREYKRLFGHAPGIELNDFRSRSRKRTKSSGEISKQKR